MVRTRAVVRRSKVLILLLGEGTSGQIGDCGVDSEFGEELRGDGCGCVDFTCEGSMGGVCYELVILRDGQVRVRRD